MTLKTKGNLIHISQLKRHPQADIVPHMRKAEWDDFYADIAMANIRTPIEILPDGTILDGHHRYEAAQKLGIEWLPYKDAPLNGDNPEVYMLKAAVLRRHLTDTQRSAMATLWKSENKIPDGKRRNLSVAQHSATETTRSQAIDLFNVSRRAIDETTYLLNNHPDLFKQVHAGELTGRNARKLVKRRERENKLAEAKVKSASALLDERCQLIHGDFRRKCLELPEASIDLILTDPPYGEYYKSLYSDLAIQSKRLLKDGASLLVMSGVMYLPDLFSILSQHLTYNWIIAYLLPRSHARVFNNKVFQTWKPILWFTNGKYTGDWMPDVIYPQPPDKAFNDWQQTAKDFEQLIHYLSPPDGIVLDPMVGWGAVAIASLNQSRQFIGIDISEDALLVTKSRLPI